jgi:hypothetical protein
MSNEILTVQATCTGKDGCVFDEEPMDIDIAITNPQTYPVGFPLAYMQKTGPAIRLIDTRTKRSFYLGTNPPDASLLKKVTEIPPGGTVTLKWVIGNDEIERFGNIDVDVSAEVILSTKVHVKSKVEDFLGRDTIHIVGKRKS